MSSRTSDVAENQRPEARCDTCGKEKREHVPLKMKAYGLTMHPFQPRAPRVLAKA